MKELTVSLGDWAVSAVGFVSALLFFWGMSALVGWPNPAGGWEVVVVVAAVVAVIPLLGRTISYLQQNRASIEGLGLKLDFTNALRLTEAATSELGLLPVQQAQNIAESGRGQLEAAAVEAARHDEVVIDLEDGHAWYLTRIFAVAAMAGPLGSPTYLIFVGQEGDRPRQALGYIASGHLVRALCREDSRYARILARAVKYLAALHDPSLPAGDLPPNLPNFQGYKYVFDQVGDAIFMRIVVDQLINPDPGVLQPNEQPPEEGPPWVNASQLRELLAAWLVKDRVELASPPKDQISAILGASGELVLAVRDGAYQGIIHVQAFTRHLLAQLAAQARD